jgi:hypothetical protein
MNFSLFFKKKKASQQTFYGVGASAPRPTPNLENQDINFVWVITFDLSVIGGPTSNYAATSVALRII